MSRFADDEFCKYILLMAVQLWHKDVVVPAAAPKYQLTNL